MSTRMKHGKPLSEKESGALARIVEGKSVVEPADVVVAASDPDSPLHNRFEWDDTAAAHAHRMDQARQLLMRYRVVVRRGSDKAKLVKVIPGLVSVGNGYRNTHEVMGTHETAAEQVRYEWARIDSLLARLGMICSSSEDFSALERWCESTRASGKRAVSSVCDGRGGAWEHDIKARERRAEG